MRSLLGTGWKHPARAVRTARRFRSRITQKPPNPYRHSTPEKPKPPVQPGFQPWVVHGSRSQLRKGSSDERGPAPPRVRRNYTLFLKLVESQFEKELIKMGKWSAEHVEYRSFKVSSQQHLWRESNLFVLALKKAFARASDKGEDSREENPLFWNLRNAFVKQDTIGLSKELKYAFQAFLMRSAFPKATTDLQVQLADLRYPSEWFPATRVMQRTVHLHVGPTNSGKTYNALKALENARTGVYAGPLRLLAYEIYSRFQAKGLPVALITGEEQRIPEGVDEYFTSCTVEMTPTGKKVDVAVIDEIQMIGDSERGSAWTDAFLGVQAKELHLCGEERTVNLIQELCSRIGDKCIVHKYERLSPLRTMKESLDNNYANLQKGDAIVTFSRVSIHSLKKIIENQTGRRCAVVYGALPPETRAQQAALFNDPNNEYDFLVASDAIGMGLNLEIKRIIFEAAIKFDGVAHRHLTVPEAKQIGGRAGRYRTAQQEITSAKTSSGEMEQETETGHPPPDSTPAPAKWGTPGFVTTLDDQDLAHIAKCFEKEAPPIKAAGLKPPAFIIERFCSFFPPNTPMNFILSRLREISRISELFSMDNMSDEIEISEAIQGYPMSIADRCTLLNSPVTVREKGQKDLIAAMARCISQSTSGHLLDIPHMDLEALDVEETDPLFSDKSYLQRLELLHKSLTLYLWLSYRYQGIFVSQRLAFHVKELLEARISMVLDRLNFTPESRKGMREAARKMAEQLRRREKQYLKGEEIPVVNEGPGLWKEEGHEEPMVEGDEEAKRINISYVVASPRTSSSRTTI